MRTHNPRGFLFDVYGRCEEWKCPQCGKAFAVDLSDWPRSGQTVWRLRHEHLKEHEENDVKSTG